MYEIKRFPHDGTVDADGHVLEPAWLWERYLERRFVERAIRIKTDADGLEYLELVGLSDLRPVETEKLRGQMLLAVAGRFGGTRLIDNVILKVDDQERE